MKRLSIKAALNVVARSLTRPTTEAQIVKQVLALSPSRAQRPETRVMTELRRHPYFLPVGRGRWLPVWVAMDGVRFRLVPSEQEREQRAILLSAFWPYVNALVPPEADGQGDLAGNLEGIPFTCVTAGNIPLPIVTPEPKLLALLQQSATEAYELALKSAALATARRASRRGLRPASTPERRSGDRPGGTDRFGVPFRPRSLHARLNVGRPDRSATMHTGASQAGDRSYMELIHGPHAPSTVLKLPTAHFPQPLGSDGHLLVTVNTQARSFVITWETSRERDDLAIRRHDRELVAMAHHLVAARRTPFELPELLFRILYASKWAKSYPGSPWPFAFARDPRLTVAKQEPMAAPIVFVTVDHERPIGRRPEPIGPKSNVFQSLSEFDETEARHSPRPTRTNNRSEVVNPLEQRPRPSLADAELAANADVSEASKPETRVILIGGARLARQVDRFLEAWEAAYAQALYQAGPGAEGGVSNLPPNTTARNWPAQAFNQAMMHACQAHNERLIRKFAPGAGAAAVRAFGRYLAQYWRTTLEAATLTALEAFLCDAYPRLPQASPEEAERYVVHLRNFYRALHAAKLIHNHAFATVMYELRELVAEKVRLKQVLEQTEVPNRDALIERLMHQ